MSVFNISDSIDIIIEDYLAKNNKCTTKRTKTSYCIQFKYDNSYDSSLDLPEDWKYNTSNLSATKSYSISTSYSNTDTKANNKHFKQWYTVKENEDDKDDNNNGIPDSIELISQDNLDDDYSLNIPTADVPDSCDATIGDREITLDNAKAGNSYNILLMFRMKCEDTNYTITVTDENTGESGSVVFANSVYGNGDSFTPCEDSYNMNYENINNGLNVQYAAEMNNSTIWISVSGYTPAKDSPSLSLNYGVNFELISASYEGKCNGDSSNYYTSQQTCATLIEEANGSTYTVNNETYTDGGATIKVKNIKNDTYDLSFVIGSFASVDDGSGRSEWDHDYLEIATNSGNIKVSVNVIDGKDDPGTIYENSTNCSVKVSLLSSPGVVLDGQDTSLNNESKIFSIHISGLYKTDTDISITGHTDEDFTNEAIVYQVGSVKITSECFNKG